jgi:TonB family protein
MNTPTIEEGMVKFKGIELKDGRTILPGLTNSFAIYDALPWHVRNRHVWISGILVLALLLSQSIKFSSSDDEYLDSIAVTVDFGDIVQPFQKKKSARRIVEVDEVFGNQYVKKKDEVVDTKDYVDPRIATAVNSVIGGATQPVDLNPEIQPQYPPAARNAGIEGTVTLELIVADDGKVLRARPVGRKLGLGLDQAAARAFKKKRYKPSIGRDGKPMTVKFYQPVRFTLY